MRHEIDHAAIALTVALGVGATSVSATPYTVDYTGVVDVVHSYTGALPSGVAVGTTVHGQIAFNGAFAEAPSYYLTSCSGFCGGDAIDARFRMADHFHLTVTAGGETQSTNSGAADLSDDYLIPGVHRQYILFDDGYASRFEYSMSVAFNRVVDPTTLFQNLDALDDLEFGNATSGSGFFRNSDWYISYRINFPLGDPSFAAAEAPEPATLAIFGAAVIALATRRWR